MKSPDETQLLQRCRSGDPLAVGILVDRYQREVFQLALAILEDPASAEEAALDSFASAIQPPGSFKGDVSFRIRLFATTVSRCRQHRRRESLARFFFRRAQGRNPSDVRHEGQAVQDERGQEFRTAASALPQLLRLPLILRYYHEMPVTKIALVLGIRERKVHSRLRAAHLALARGLEVGSGNAALKTISHERARQLLHRRREGLEAGDNQALEAHQFICEECRAYGRLLTSLERDLSRDFHNHLDPSPTPIGLSGKVQKRLEQAKRRRRAYSLVWALAAAFVLIALLLIFRDGSSRSRLQSSLNSTVPTGTELDQAASIPGTSPTAAPTEFTEDDIPPALVVPRRLSGGQLIAFTSRRDGNEEIYVMAPDGRDQTNLTNHPAADYLPAWSPDGQQLAFVSDRTGKPEIYIMAHDGSGLTQLTDLPNAAGFSYLSWSPGGDQLAAGVGFLFPVSGEVFGRIFVFQSDGSGFVDLTRNQMPVTADDPKWSPAGDWIAYVRCGQAPCYLRRVRPDGTGDEQVNLSVRNTRAYVWSRDGSRLAYISSCTYCELYDDDPPDVRLAGLDDSEPVTFHRFEGLSLDFFNLSWSPDESYLAFTANEGVESIRHLYLLPAGGGDLLDVAAFEPGDWYLSSLSWSPDGSHLVLDAGVVAMRDIFVVDLQARLRGEVGTGVTNLTAGSPGMDYQPQWQP